MYQWLEFVFLCVLIVLVPPPVTRLQWGAFVVGDRASGSHGADALEDAAMNEGEHKPVLTPDEEAEGWRVIKQGGMWVKTLDVSKLRLAVVDPTRPPAWVEKLAREWEQRANDLDARGVEFPIVHAWYQAADELRTANAKARA